MSIVLSVTAVGGDVTVFRGFTSYISIFSVRGRISNNLTNRGRKSKTWEQAEKEIRSFIYFIHP